MTTTKKPTMNRIATTLNRLGYSYKRDNTGNTYAIYMPTGNSVMYLKLCPDGTILRSGHTLTLESLQNELLQYKALNLAVDPR